MKQHQQRILEDAYGRRTTYEEIDEGAPLGPKEWEVSQEDIDNQCLLSLEFSEFYSVNTPFGGPVAPPLITYRAVRTLFWDSYVVRGLLAGYHHQQYDVIRPDVTYTLHGAVTRKYVKRDREWLEYEVRCTAPDGHDVYRSTRRHVMHFIPASTSEGQGATLDEQIAAVGDDALSEGEVFPYAPPFVDRSGPWRTPGDSGSYATWNGSWATRSTPLGAEVPPVSLQSTWRQTRDYYELTHHEKGVGLFPPLIRARNVHTDQAVAESEGQQQPNAIGPLVLSTVSRMMTYVGGGEWPRSGAWDVRFRKQMALNDFFTARGRVKGIHVEGDRARVVCDVWVENQMGERTIVGEASVLVD